ncbi:5-hydroxytryptamine receptor 3B-like [Kryptolebias marmoratus]|uniref:5-hydroxytryptamine receptor 3B-like n=1 Tax=Kryptolebias marmoratus TaxID=37003 RepID=UPI0007F8FD90|nr:5-hydroxytryptamine receptor 3B-like [Kryptolebias marmoratus]
MILTFFYLALLTGGNISRSESPELQGDQQKSNDSSTEIPGGNISSSESPELQDDQQKSNSSTEIPAHTCTYQDVLNFLNLTKNNEMYTMSRPTLNHTESTRIFLHMMIYAILDVRESDQTFISYIWIEIVWINPHLIWMESKFCGISKLYVPTETLWKPDLTIEEMIEKDKAPPSPFLKIYSYGVVEYINNQVVVSTCRMHVYRFPFDIQRCNMSFKSVVHSDEDLHFYFMENNTALTEWSRKVMQTQYEWLFVNQSVTNKIVDYFGFNQTVIVYTITMKRRSSLYVANFLLPVLFFLCLDFASLLMSDSSGDKIGFKVTVLLAVTVMQLVLNEILPVSSDRIPLVVIYCIGIYGLMLLSLLETIFVKYLKEKDSTSQDSDTDNDPRMNKERDLKKGASIDDEMTDQTSSDYKEGSSSQLTELFLAIEKVSDELGVIKKIVLLPKNEQQEKPGYWTRVANRINKGFTIFYITAVTVFLCSLFPVWIS